MRILFSDNGDDANSHLLLLVTWLISFSEKAAKVHLYFDNLNRFFKTVSAQEIHES